MKTRAIDQSLSYCAMNYYTKCFRAPIRRHQYEWAPCSLSFSILEQELSKSGGLCHDGDEGFYLNAVCCGCCLNWSLKGNLTSFDLQFLPLKSSGCTHFCQFHSHLSGSTFACIELYLKHLIGWQVSSLHMEKTVTRLYDSHELWQM